MTPSEPVWGSVLLAGSSLAALLLALFGRTRLPRGIVIVLLALLGAGIGSGLALVLGEASWPQAIAAVAVLSVLTPFHARVVLGPLGRRA